MADTCNPALGRLRQEDCKLEGSLMDIVRFYLNTKTEHRHFKSQISIIQQLQSHSSRWQVTVTQRKALKIHRPSFFLDEPTDLKAVTNFVAEHLPSVSERGPSAGLARAS